MAAHSTIPARAIATLLLAAAAASCGGAGTRQPDDGGRPAGLVLVTVDGLAPAALTLYGGSAATPALERLAKRGRFYADAFTGTPMSRPAAATYLTGLAADRHGVLDDHDGRLPDDVGTLAERLLEAGYRTAAFPDSSLLQPVSGLTRGFEVVDDPPSPGLGGTRLRPQIRGAAESASDFGSWLQSLPADAKWFAWLHFSSPMIEQFERLDAEMGRERRQLRARLAASAKEASGVGVDEDSEAKPDPKAPTLASFDAALGAVLDAVAMRGADRTAILVAGTSGDIVGTGDEAPGPGFSLADPALRVAVVGAWPGLEPRPEADGRRIWAVDLPATLADLAGVALDARSEGISLRSAPPPDRILFHHTRAPLEQFGWFPLRAARRGGDLVVQGREEPAGADAELLAALESRPVPAVATVPAETVAEIARRHGVEAEPLPSGGRPWPAGESARRAASWLWAARIGIMRHPGRVVEADYGRAIEADPDLLAARLERAQLSLRPGPQLAQGQELLRLAARYPWHLETAHWLSHVLWNDSRQEARRLLELALPHKGIDSDVLYDLACLDSLEGNLDRAVDFLRRSILSGYRYWQHIDVDPDLRALRESGRMAELMKEFGR